VTDDARDVQGVSRPHALLVVRSVRLHDALGIREGGFLDAPSLDGVTAAARLRLTPAPRARNAGTPAR
jgi:hypothetical protein